MRPDSAMERSPGCSSAASAATADPPETDALSDDSGVDVKPQAGGAYLPPLDSALSPELGGKRNKRKSSEPKRRKDVLLMKRFRWDTDEEDVREEEEEEEDVFDVLDGERPSSGDSGCRVSGRAAEDEDRRVAGLPDAGRRRRSRTDGTRAESSSSSLRQSVIRCGSPFVPPSAAPSAEDRDPQEEEEEREARRRPSRNYKSMSRQRRIEANARERTRVHTISAAFESLRRSVPAYAHNQKLSKLAILRIASAYIVALACLSGQKGAAEPSMPECVERCTRTIQAEGRSRRRTTSKD